MALLNIVNNIPSVDLGEHLQQFKEFTRSFTPALRGEAIGNFEFVKQIHNSFARLVSGAGLLQLFFAFPLGRSAVVIDDRDRTDVSNNGPTDLWRCGKFCMGY